jgi:hypothetical protein
MSGSDRFEPAPFLVVSDLGQLRAFVETSKINILRVLQRQEATSTDVASIIGEPESVVAEEIRALHELRLIRYIGEDDKGQEVYRAAARIYDLQPEPEDNGVVMAQLAAATLTAVTREVVSSLSDWPDQRMNYESRRRRIPPSRMTEFNERLNELLAEFWGDPEAPVEDDSNDPVMAFSSIWYRYPDTE